MVVEVVGMDSLPLAAHRFAAPCGRPKRAAPRFVNPTTWLLFPATAQPNKNAARRAALLFGGGGGNGFAAFGSSPLRGALRASKTGCAAFCEPHYVASLPSHCPAKQKRRPAGGIVVWWRWWESNPRPQALRSGVYMLIPSLILLRATRRAGKTHSQFGKDLTAFAPNERRPRSREIDPWDPDARARAGQRALGWFLSS